MPAEAKLAPFHITQADGNITAANGAANTWSDVWKYQVPQGTGIVLQAGDPFSAYLYASGECGLYDCYVKVVVRDPSGQDEQLVFGPALYKRVREFQNRNTMCKLAPIVPVKIYPRQWIVVVVKDNGTVAYATSYFSLLTSKVAIPLT